MAKAANKANKIVLIIEDDEMLLRALYLAFLHSGFTIATASDGETGLRMTERLKPNLVLLDLLLPKMSGFEYLQAMKSNPALKRIPVIILSNLGDKDDMAKAKTLGAADYFIKADTDLSVLARKVNEILKV